MMTFESFRRIAFVAFSLALLAPVLIRGSKSNWTDSGTGLLAFELIPLLPLAAYFLGVRWCRYVVGVLSSLWLLLWLLIPMALHEIDRRGSFWLIWWMVIPVLIFSSIMSFVRGKERNHAQH
jgi:hypothetical protein